RAEQEADQREPAEEGHVGRAGGFDGEGRPHGGREARREVEGPAQPARRQVDERGPAPRRLHRPVLRRRHLDTMTIAGSACQRGQAVPEGGSGGAWREAALRSTSSLRRSAWGRASELRPGGASVAALWEPLAAPGEQAGAGAAEQLVSAAEQAGREISRTGEGSPRAGLGVPSSDSGVPSNEARGHGGGSRGPLGRRQGSPRSEQRSPRSDNEVPTFRTFGPLERSRGPRGDGRSSWLLPEHLSGGRCAGVRRDPRACVGDESRLTTEAHRNSGGWKVPLEGTAG